MDEKVIKRVTKHFDALIDDLAETGFEYIIVLRNQNSREVGSAHRYETGGLMDDLYSRIITYINNHVIPD